MSRELPRQKTQVEILWERLQASGVKNFHVTPGSGNPTAEQIAEQVNIALDAIGRGDYELIENFDD
jgi:hypothetical protein